MPTWLRQLMGRSAEHWHEAAVRHELEEHARQNDLRIEALNQRIRLIEIRLGINTDASDHPTA